jgi:hypothetical protein
MVGWSTPRPGCFIPGKDPVNWVGLRASIGGCGNLASNASSDTRTVQPVASSCTDYAIPVHGRPTNRSSIPVRDNKFSLLWCTQAYFGYHPANPMRTAGLPPGELKRSEREADHSARPVSSLGMGTIPPFPHTASQHAKEHHVLTWREQQNQPRDTIF